MRFAIAAAILAHSVPATSEMSEKNIQRIFPEEKQDIVSTIQGKAMKLASQRSKFLNLVKAKKEASRGYLKNTPNSEENFQQCDPEAEDADVGVLSCGVGRYCVESGDSKMGGYCVSTPDELDRSLQGAATLLNNVYASFCSDGSEFSAQCNCTNYDPTAYTLDVMCMETEECNSYTSICAINVTSCISYDFTISVTAPGTYATERCFEDSEPYVQRTCYGSVAVADGLNDECIISVDDVECNSCVFDDRCDSYAFDCTNTGAKRAGSTCDEGVFVAPILYYLRTYGCDYYACPICGGEDFVSTNPGGTIDFGEGATTCAAVAQVALLGGFDETFCQEVVVPNVTEACGCVEFGSTPVPVPTAAPIVGTPSETSVPTAESPTVPPVVFTFPPVIPTSAPTSAGNILSLPSITTAASVVGFLMTFFQLA
jgi:hypothetical protein